jgi:CRP-like cAMP-binding protein
MTTLREAAQMALEALEDHAGSGTSLERGPIRQETLIRCLSESRLLSGNRIACQALAKAGTLVKYSKGKSIIEQGADDDWIYFLVSGAVKVFVNNRHIATREACTHLGEMSVIDPQARRSATVISDGDTITLRVAADEFLRISNEHPEIWRRIASELASRIRQRNAFHRAPNQDRAYRGTQMTLLELLK